TGRLFRCRVAAVKQKGRLPVFVRSLHARGRVRPADAAAFVRRARSESAASPTLRQCASRGSKRSRRTAELGGSSFTQTRRHLAAGADEVTPAQRWDATRRQPSVVSSS